MLRQAYSFSDEPTALAAFGADDWAMVQSWVAVTGTLHHATGETTTDADGNAVTVMETLSGFHVDAIDAVGDGAHFPSDGRVYPKSPSMGVM